MLKSAPLLTLLLLAPACLDLEDDPNETGARADAVVNGTPVVGFPSTGGLLRGGTGDDAFMQCSGTLIGCDTFVTAAHCVCEDSQTCNTPIPPSQLFVYFQNGGVYDVSSVAIEPNYSFPGFGDIAVVRLATPVVGIKPTPIITSNPPSNSQMRIVGFGLTFNGENDSGIKREGILQRSPCNGFGDDTHMCFNPGSSPAVSCSGDSGGPNFIDIGGTTHLGAVVSGGGTQSSCTGGQKFATNVSAFTTFIQTSSGPLGGAQCGALANADDATSQIVTGQGAGPGGEFTIEVPERATELRVGANAIFAEFDLFVRFGEPGDSSAYDCWKRANQASMCTINSPRAGTWYVNIDAQTPFQIAMTAFAGGPDGVADEYEAESGSIFEVSAESGLLGNDSAGLGQALAAELVSEPENGGVNIGPAGDFTYLANPEFVGTDTFTYRVREGDYVSQPVLVTITVTEPGGCGCTSSGEGGSGGFLLVVLGLLAVARRRRLAR